MIENLFLCCNWHGKSQCPNSVITHHVTKRFRVPVIPKQTREALEAMKTSAWLIVYKVKASIKANKHNPFENATIKLCVAQMRRF